jgi:hypothetical protein
MLLISPLPHSESKVSMQSEFATRIGADYRFDTRVGTMARLSFGRTLTFFAALVIPLCGSEIAPARDSNPELQAALKKLEGATSVTLMIIPWSVVSSARIDESQLPNVACVYEMRVEPAGLALKDLLEIFDNSFLEYQIGYQSLREVRIGIVFKSKDSVLQQFYFEDWGGVRNIHGLTEPTRILASPDFANQLRALVKRKELDLTKGMFRSCSQT